MFSSRIANSCVQSRNSRRSVPCFQKNVRFFFVYRKSAEFVTQVEKCYRKGGPRAAKGGQREPEGWKKEVRDAARGTLCRGCGTVFLGLFVRNLNECSARPAHSASCGGSGFRISRAKSSSRRTAHPHRPSRSGSNRSCGGVYRNSIQLPPSWEGSTAG